MKYLGAHIFAKGGFKNTPQVADDLNANSIQMMFSAPMRWATTEINPEYIETFIENLQQSEVKKVLAHGIYLINLARKDKQMFHLSKMSVASHVNAMYEVEKALAKTNPDIDCLGMTFHPGSAKDLTPEEGVKRISQGLNWIIDETEGGMILLESAAGAGSVMGDTLEELAEMREGVEDKDRVAYVLDTQHMYVSGYDWVNDLEGIIKNIESTITLDLVKAIHLNDSMKEFNSHKDRHANLGEGLIGEEAIKNLVNHPKMQNIPFILETPALKESETAKSEVDKLLSYV